ncbi:filensin [Triplophysa rosa]|uniref:Filensin n=1 Tax=Triplophysa rosa TaxID=992332 RepID=A0A9W8C1J3_TRIRA|nr:filensin [Triplophysa rosa]KAI7805214.1 putative filensin [Triplophysa rosa]
MFKTRYLREVRKDKYERSDVFEEPSSPETATIAGNSTKSVLGWDSLQELNSRFACYINRARVLEQRNAVFRKQLETLQRMEEESGLEEAFIQQISVNRQRIRELQSDRAKLERELKDAERMLDEYNSRYRNECEYQEQLRRSLEQLNKEADTVLLRNLEYQIQLQFLQDDVNATKERQKKNLAEIQTYLNILHQINHTIPLLANVSVSEEHERLIAQRRVPALRSQLEEYKSAICQLQAQKQRLQKETSVLEQSIKTTQESYDDEIQLYNEQIESLRKDTEEAEKSLEKYTNNCRQLAVYQTSLENELERNKRIIENEDNRLNSAIIGTPITLLTTNYKYTHSPSLTRKGKDITQVIQDITSVKPRQKTLAKKVLKKKEITSKGAMESGLDARTPEEFEKEEKAQMMEEQAVRSEQSVPREDVPDGAQISKAFDTLCNIIHDRMRRVRKPEPIADFFTKGRYVLVMGDSNYLDPCFISTTPSASHVFVTIRDGMIPYDPDMTGTPSPPPMPPIGPTPQPEKGKDDGKWKEGGNGKPKNGEPHSKAKEPEPSPSPPPGPRDSKSPSPPPGPKPPLSQRGSKTSEEPGNFRGPPPMPSHSSMSYEKVEVVESIEKLSADKKVKGYEEMTTVVETMIEKTSKKKHSDKSS